MISIYRRALRVLSIVLSLALVVGCSTHMATEPLPSANGASGAAPTGSKTFHFIHAVQSFKVPSGVKALTIVAFGARGGGSKQPSYGPPGALGAKITATIPVTPGQLLYVYVGGKGILNKRGAGGGGFNGGGAAGRYAYGGGGSSDIRIGKGRLSDRVLVAAGGGGSGESFRFMSVTGSYYCFGGAGGVGGATTGGDGGYGQCGGIPFGGYGATETSGGQGGAGGHKGSGSNGGSGTNCHGGAGTKGKLFDGGSGGNVCSGRGAGGGGGYYGGGGGGSGGCCNMYAGGASGAGGGGGSSYVEPSAKKVHRTSGGGYAGNGEIIITW
jgi:hypothetical protein